MAGAVGIVFGLCVLSFTLGAALMYVLVRRREDAASVAAEVVPEVVPEVAADSRSWVKKPAVVEPVDGDYDSRPIYRSPVVGLPQLEPALAVFAEPVVAEPVVAEPVVAEPVVEAVAEPVVEVAEPEVDALAVEPEPEPETEPELVAEPEPEPEVVVGTALPPPARPQAVEQTTWVEREDFRQRYLRTFDEVRRKAGSN
ncbi:hypothetical protein ACFWNN_33855 [Lentzea sp. NPDC058450]|uniref:hypothetical protein n=1 Tax=Lentzea sp. NPDC058450 TaxID=3346505 RepID=UPI003661D81E